jgi:hypothetical protein
MKEIQMTATGTYKENLLYESNKKGDPSALSTLDGSWLALPNF